jgi:hypothetical protein
VVRYWVVNEFIGAPQILGAALWEYMAINGAGAEMAQALLCAG